MSEKRPNRRARRSQESYFGKYRGLVAENEDPEQLGRLRLLVPSLFGETVTGWALPCLPFGGLADQGLFLVPEVGARVWVEFEQGDPSRPIWVGTFWQASGEAPAEAALTPPTTRLLKTASGHLLQFDDRAGEETLRLLHPRNAELTIDRDGSLALTDAQGASVTLDADAGEVRVQDANGNHLAMSGAGTTLRDAHGNQIEMGPSGVNIQGARVVLEGTQVMLGGAGGEPLIRGTSFLSLFATHVHTCSAPGSPSSPPLPQGELATLSSKTTTR